MLRSMRRRRVFAVITKGVLCMKFDIGKKILANTVLMILLVGLAVSVGMFMALRIGRSVDPLMQEKIISGGETLNSLWPFDGAHPDDKGYVVFFEAVKQGFDKAIAEKKVCKLPEKPLFGEYKTVKRIKLSETELPKGWSVAKTYRTSFWFDGLASRWMGDVAMCDAKDAGNIEPLKLEVEGSILGIFGEANEQGLGFEVMIDGKPFPLITMKNGKEESRSDVWDMNTSRFGKGNLFMWRQISDSLANEKHVVELIPVIPEGVEKGQLRIESVCVAGE